MLFYKTQKKSEEAYCFFFLQNVNIIQHSNLEEVVDLSHDRDASRVCDDDINEDKEEEDDDDVEHEVDVEDDEEKEEEETEDKEEDTY